MQVRTEVDLTEEGKGVVTMPVPVVNVLSLVQYLFGKHGHGIKIAQENVRQYWQHASDFFPWGKDHPATRDKVHLPFALYGGEARYTDQAGFSEKVTAILLSCPLWRPASCRNSRFLFAIRCSLCTGFRTLWPVFQYIAWSLNILFPQTVYCEGF